MSEPTCTCNLGNKETYRQQARVLKALANESRLLIIRRLNEE